MNALTAIVIAFIDTGAPAGMPFCPGYEPVAIGDQVTQDVHGHATGVYRNFLSTSLSTPVCVWSIKPELKNERFTPESYRKALELLLTKHVDVVNLSIDGAEPMPDEEKTIKALLDRGVKVVVASGNDGVNLDKDKRYPASLDTRLIVVGDVNGKKSNTGTRVVWEKSVFGTGTSFSAGVRSGRVVRCLHHSRLRKAPRSPCR